MTGPEVPTTPAHALTAEWARLLPRQPALGAELLRRWSEPHRHYHDCSHLAAALRALDQLGGTAATERLAIWFHDAVHTGHPGPDEQASAEFACDALTAARLDPVDVREVARLVLLTTDHSPTAGDAPGARVSDADLAILGAKPVGYLASVAALRAESPELSDAQWRDRRAVRVAELLATPRLFHTELARRWWLAQAQENLVAERDALVTRD